MVDVWYRFTCHPMRAWRAPSPSWVNEIVTSYFEPTHTSASSVTSRPANARTRWARTQRSIKAWLGHVDPKSTYWYLQQVPQLLALAAERLELIEGDRP